MTAGAPSVTIRTAQRPESEEKVETKKPELKGRYSSLCEQEEEDPLSKAIEAGDAPQIKLRRFRRRVGWEFSYRCWKLGRLRRRLAEGYGAAGKAREEEERGTGSK